MIFTLSEFRSLHTVAGDSRFSMFKIFFPVILLTSVDFPELVSPENKKMIILNVIQFFENLWLILIIYFY